MSSQDRPSVQDPGPSTSPTESDLVPVMDSITTSPDDSSMPRQAVSTGHLQPRPAVETQDTNSLRTAPATPPNCSISETQNRSSPNQSVKLTTTTTGPPSSDTAYGRLIQIQTLQARVTELQSSIRKGQQILKQQQKNEAPIEELTAKWKKASQEGAQVLLGKYTEQQSAFGGWGDYDSNRSDDRMSMNRGFHGYGSQQLPWSYNTDMPMNGVSSLQELGPDGLQALEEYIGHQDVQQDLPTVEEAIRSRSRPEVTAMTHPPTKMTTMEKLLLGLGIDLDVIGYDPEQDTFIS
ncbi:hypothetical protein KI688_010939 [Linnemannia hyalina]|uniref:Uncharacterized protein n=1 Tax=Linnemannia hyalina TaxID=64524 RepID=A0A9P7XY12_9FUNG|nr:hypothetical protein KI688_010939 [Linnemannia hyalina]